MPRAFLPDDYRLLTSYYTEVNRQLKWINLSHTLPELGNWGENPMPWIPPVHTSVDHRINSNIKGNISVGFLEENRKSVHNLTVHFWKWKHLATSKHLASTSPWREEKLNMSIKCENKLSFLPKAVQIISAKAKCFQKFGRSTLRLILISYKEKGKMSTCYFMLIFAHTS